VKQRGFLKSRPNTHTQLFRPCDPDSSRLPPPRERDLFLGKPGEVIGR
jgi:hypothetical protein